MPYDCDNSVIAIIGSPLQPVELAGVLAGDLVHDFGRKAGELLLDVFRGFRPDAVGVRVGDL
jgi:hypothetical protein